MLAKKEQYREFLPDQLSIQHKITEGTEKKQFHLHNELEFIYALSGNLVYRTDTEDIPIPQGSIILINSMSLHYISYKEDGNLCDRYVVYFEPQLLQGLNTPEFNLMDCFSRRSNYSIIRPSRKDVLLLENSLLQLESAFHSYKSLLHDDNNPIGANAFHLFMKFELGQLMLLLNKVYYQQYGAPSSASYQSHSQTVMNICNHIDSHFDEPLTTDTIAHKFLMSKTQLYNIFKEILSISVSDYISQVRLAQAKHMLINTQYSVEIISQKVGYTSVSSFSRTFGSKVGLTPLQYRKKQHSISHKSWDDQADFRDKADQQQH